MKATFVGLEWLGIILLYEFKTKWIYLGELNSARMHLLGNFSSVTSMLFSYDNVTNNTDYFGKSLLFVISGIKYVAMKEKSRYMDRDISWLSFNYRVFEESKDESLPLFERIKFLAIYSSNLDEFFRVRVANLRRLIELDKKKLNQQLEIKPRKLLQKILGIVNEQLEEYGSVLRKQIVPALKKNKVVIYQDEHVKPAHKPFIRKYFKNRILSFLTPAFIDNKKELFLENRELYLALELVDNRNGGQTVYAYVNIPSDHLDRYLQLPPYRGSYYFITLDDIIRANLDFLFPDYDILGCYSIKLNRDADLNIEDEYSGDLVKKIKKQLSKREIGVPSRFLYDQSMPKELLKLICKTFSLSDDDLVPGGRYHNLNDLMGLKNPFKPKLQDVDYPAIVKSAIDNSYSFFDAIDSGDHMLHFPYQSYDYVLRFFNEAAVDPNVKEIKATFYRVAQDSYIVNALISAANNGKKVTVFVELKARFDEANNIYWAERMEEAGIRIIYSIPGLKVHAKVALVKREVGKNSKGYAFFGTGNFNESTAKIYADHGLFTCDKNMIGELDQLFKYLYKRTPVKDFKHLLVSQFNLQQKFLDLIDNEIANAKKGKKASVIIKVNNLEDRVMIDKLYEASQAGVKVTMIIRSICTMIPGLKGISDNVQIFRLVDRHLEHARIFVFHNDGDHKIYLGSADWMKRNLYHRIEVVFPLYDAEVRKEITKLLWFQLKDTAKMRQLDEQHLNRVRLQAAGKAKVRAQVDFYNWLKSRAN